MFLARLLPKRVLSRQARKPTGFIGQLIMSNLFKNVNNDLNGFVFETLKLQSSDRVLEIGFGPGKLMNKMASVTTHGHIEGIDFSDTMISEAVKNNEEYIVSGRVSIREGDCKELHFSDEIFDKVCSVNTLYFWNPPKIYLSEIFRVLKSGGQLVLGIRNKEQMSTLPLDDNIFTTYSLDEVIKLLSDTGFSNAHVQEKEGVHFTSYCVIATKL